jgi:hypothetical protein
MTIVKWLSIGLLLLALLFWSSSPRYGFTVELFVGSAAASLAWQAMREKRGRWTAAFLAVMAYFCAAAAEALWNPLAPAILLGGATGSLAIVFSIAVFMLSFFALKARPRMSMAPIVDRPAAGEAL